MADTQIAAPTPSTHGDDPTELTPIEILKAGASACERERETLLVQWRENVTARRGKTSDTGDDDKRSPVTSDWVQTKGKIAQLFSQVPEVVVKAENEEYAPAAFPFQKRLNARLHKAGIGDVMFEVLPDMVNASGFGAIVTRFESIGQDKEVPLQDPTIEKMGLLQSILAKVTGALGMQQTKQVTARRFITERVAIEDLIWPLGYEGSNFNRGPWIGRKGRTTRANAKRMFKMTPEQLHAASGATSNRHGTERLRDTGTGDPSTRAEQSGDEIEFQEFYYWRHLYHEDETSFERIQHVVLVEGVTDPVIDDKWAGQKDDPDTGGIIGAMLFPIQVGTLNYISGEPLPPSDSSVGRWLVNELEESRWDSKQQRKYSKPLRWVDVNRIDAETLVRILTGQIQDFIPVSGQGDRVVGEVARSNAPRENFEFDRIYKSDLNETWSAGPNQNGTMASGERSASEARIVQGNFATRQAQERDRVVLLFLNVATVLAGLMCLFDDFTLPDVSPQDAQRLQNFTSKRINHEMAFSLRGDATVRLSSDDEFSRIERFVNIAGKSGFVSPQPLLARLAELSQIDPAQVIRTPEKPGPEPPALALTFKGEDLMNPGVWAMLVKSGQAPTPEEMEAGKKLLASTMTMTPGPGPGSDPMAPGGAPAPMPVPGGPDPNAPMRDDRPEWQTVDRVNSRRDASQN